MRFLVAILLMASAAYAQDQAEAARVAAGCGANSVQFEVKTDKKLHPVAQPEPGKAVVYILGDENIDNVGGIGAVVTRVGVDGSWVGANGHKGYFFFALEPGTHRLCTERQSGLKSRLQISAAKSFTAEAGKVYYFRTHTPDHPLPGETVEVVRIDPAQARLLIPLFAQSTFKLKNDSEEKKQSTAKHWF